MMAFKILILANAGSSEEPLSLLYDKCKIVIALNPFPSPIILSLPNHKQDIKEDWPKEIGL